MRGKSNPEREGVKGRGEEKLLFFEKKGV